MLEGLLNITKKDIARTYTDGERILKEYLEVKDRIERGWTLGRIVREHFGIKSADRTRYVVFYNRFKAWSRKKEPKIPCVINGINTLVELGLLPFTYSNEKFDIINILGSWLFWRGSLSNNSTKNRTRYEMHLNYKNPQEAINIKHTLSKLRATEPYAPDGYIDITGSIPRLFTQLGFPIGEKSQEEVTIPTYIEDLYYAKNLSKNEKKFRHKTIKTFIDGLFYLRGRLQNNDITLNMHHMSTQEKSKKQAELISNMIKEFYDLGSIIRAYERHTGTFTHRLCIKGANQEELKMSYVDKINELKSA
ncbi:hypothetical protein DRJ17_01360 [Candidatus Woesearchaeota archaeon]|nr:MAG: hypothetical protein DRJ17_01360 [Candidatus Woesearchaeota archaeon]